jgi:hypothetical protein
MLRTVDLNQLTDMLTTVVKTLREIQGTRRTEAIANGRKSLIQPTLFVRAR